MSGRDSEKEGFRDASKVILGEEVLSDREGLEKQIIEDCKKATEILKARKEGGKVGDIDWSQYLSQDDSELPTVEQDILRHARSSVTRYKEYDWGENDPKIDTAV